MSLGLRAVLAAVLSLTVFGALPAMAAGEFTDSAGRIVVIPERVSYCLFPCWLNWSGG